MREPFVHPSNGAQGGLAEHQERQVDIAGLQVEPVCLDGAKERQVYVQGGRKFSQVQKRGLIPRDMVRTGLGVAVAVRSEASLT